MLLCSVLTPFRLNYDVSYPISHFTLTLDGITSFQRVQNVTNICKHLRYRRKFGGTLQCNGGKVKETKGLK